jgi:hypothetical protein
MRETCNDQTLVYKYNQLLLTIFKSARLKQTHSDKQSGFLHLSLVFCSLPSKELSGLTFCRRIVLSLRGSIRYQLHPVMKVLYHQLEILSVSNIYSIAISANKCNVNVIKILMCPLQKKNTGTVQ